MTIFLKIYKEVPPIYGTMPGFVIEQAGFLGDQYVCVATRKTGAAALRGRRQTSIARNRSTCEEVVARGAAGFIKRMDETARKSSTPPVT